MSTVLELMEKRKKAYFGKNADTYERMTDVLIN